MRRLLLRNCDSRFPNSWSCFRGRARSQSYIGTVLGEPPWHRRANKNQAISAQPSERAREDARRALHFPKMKRSPLAPVVRISVARYYPDWAKRRARDAGYIVDDATSPDNTRPESVEPPVIGASPMLAVSRNYPPQIVEAFCKTSEKGRTVKLSMPG
jgi:hypothetical protein